MPQSSLSLLQGLSKLLADHAPGCLKEQKFDNYFGRKIAVDASMHIYQFLVRICQATCSYAALCSSGTQCCEASLDRESCGLQVVVGRTGDQMLSNEAGEVTRYAAIHSGACI